MRNIFLVLVTNILVMITITIVLQILGVNHYLTAYGIDYASLAIMCLVWGMGGAFISLMLSKFMAKTLMRVQIVDQEPQYASLVQTIHNLSKAAGLPKMPEVGIYHSPEVNAFATGPSKSNSLVAVSTGLLERMDRDEVEGVLGHEVAHIANGDMVTMTLVQGVVNAFVMFFARIAAFAVSQAMRNDDDESPAHGGGWMHFILVMVFQILFSILGQFVVSWFSRYREFRADAGSARLGGREKMIRALKSLQRTFEPDMAEAHPSISSMKISNKKGWLALLSTHPPLEDRIAALEGFRA